MLTLETHRKTIYATIILGMVIAMLLSFGLARYQVLKGDKATRSELEGEIGDKVDKSVLSKLEENMGENINNIENIEQTLINIQKGGVPSISVPQHATTHEEGGSDEITVTGGMMASNITFTTSGTITAGTLSDGTATIAGGAVTGASGNVSMWTNDAGYLTDITAESLDDLSDVNIPAPNNNDVLTFNAGASEWQAAPGGGAPTNAQYVTLSNDAALTSERVLTGTANQIIITDGGANNPVTLSTPQDIATGSSPTFAGLTLNGNLVMGANNITSVGSVTASGTIQANTLTDGTATIAGGNITGAGNITASGTVQGGTLTDGTFSVTGGAVTGVSGNISMWTNDANYVASGDNVSVLVNDAGYLTAETDPVFTAWDKSTGISITASQVSDFSEATDDRVALLIQNGTGLSWIYNDVANTLTGNVSITQYTDEDAQDAVGAMIADTNTIDLTYTDATPELKADLTYQDTVSVDLSEDALGLKATALPAGIDHNSLQNYVANEHINHTSVLINAGTGLSGGGDISATRTLSLSHLGIESLTDPNANRLMGWDDTDNATKWFVIGSGLSYDHPTYTLSATGVGVEVDPVYSANSFAVAMDQNVDTTASPTFAGLNLGTGNISSVGNIIPAADSTYTLGDATPKYWSAGYFDRLYLNSTAYIDGAVAGKIGLNTTSPDEEFHIEGNLMVDAYNNMGAGGGIFFREGFGSGSAGDSPKNLAIRLRGINTPASPDGFEFDAYDGITFNTGYTDRLQILPEGHFVPVTDSSYNLGSSSLYWANTYTDQLYVNNQIGVSGDADLLSLASGALTVNGTVTTTGLDINHDGVFARDTITNYSATNAYRGELALRRAQGSLASPTATLNSNWMGVLSFAGYDGTAFQTGASFQTIADGDWSGTNRGTYLTVQLVPTGSTTLTTRWVWDSNGTYRPYADSTVNLGNSSKYIANTYTDQLYVNNQIGVSGDADLLSLASDALTVNGTGTFTGDVGVGGNLTLGSSGAGERLITWHSDVAGAYVDARNYGDYFIIYPPAETANFGMYLRTGTGGNMGLDVGGNLLVRDRDASYATRLSVDSSNGNITVYGDIGPSGDSDLLQLASGTLTVNGNINAYASADPVVRVTELSGAEHRSIRLGVDNTNSYNYLLSTFSSGGVWPIHIRMVSSDAMVIGTDLSTTMYGDLTVNGNIELPDAKYIKIGAGNSADNATLLQFSIDRAWSFKVDGEGSGTALALQPSTNSKQFKIKSQDGTDSAKFYTSNTDSVNYLSLTGYLSVGRYISVSSTSETFGTSRIFNNNGNNMIALSSYGGAIIGGYKNSTSSYGALWRFKSPYGPGSNSYFKPETDSESDLGQEAQYWRNAYIDTIHLNDKITKYNGVATEGYGVPAIVDRVGLTGQTSNIATTNCTNTNTAGEYRVNVYFDGDGATGGTPPSPTGDLTISWNDGGVRSKVYTINGTGYDSEALFIRNSSGYITYSTSITNLTYNLYITVERVN